MPTFPFDLSSYKPVALDPSNPKLTDDQKADLQYNIDLCRDAITFFTAYAGARGLSGHSGGPFDTVPEVVIIRGFLQDGSRKIMPIFWDEAGHRVATQYLLSALEGALPPEALFHYREYDKHLPGHPELGLTPGVKFSSGRLGHVWPFINGVAMAHPDHTLFMLGSDGSQQEGNDAEAARLCVAQNLNIKLLIDDNNVTIAGHPTDYLPGFDVAETLKGHGLGVTTGDGENLDNLYQRMCTSLEVDGPVALVNKRPMAPGIPGVEGSIHGHDVFKTQAAIDYFENRGTPEAKAAIELLNTAPKVDSKPVYPGSSEKVGSCRNLFGSAVVEVLEGIDAETRAKTVKVFDCDLEGSTGIKAIHDAFPELFVLGGIMERGNFSAAAGFGFDADKQGIFATFSAFLEMVVSEITMARLNKCNVLAHFSHAGVDDMADNTCHFGVNNLFADGGLDFHDAADSTGVYFPGDPAQFVACVKTIFHQKGLRFVFSNRSKIPYLLNPDGSRVFADGCDFTPGQDVFVRTGKAGTIVTYGSATHRAVAAADALKQQGHDVGVLLKATLNKVDDDATAKVLETGFVLVAEELNAKTSLGVRYGAELAKRGYTGKFNHIGTHVEGPGGLWRQMGAQGLDPDGIAATAKALV
ncbi:MAG: transketolase C-terminal domain-containing protein [Planctomycetota bacterium]